MAIGDVSEGGRQTAGEDLLGAADEAYEAIRHSITDIETIARNTGIKSANIQKVKQHLFYEEHLLDRYVALGVACRHATF